jgi:hypothetical protein
MSFSWVNDEGSVPIAVAGKRTLYLNQSMVEDGKKNIHLNGDIKLQQIPSNNERDVLYISAMSGSGKSYYTAEYVKQYHKKYPKNEIFLFSTIDDDKCLDSLKYIKRINIKSEAFYNSDITAKDFEKSCVIFDDCDVISDKHAKKKVFQILDEILQTGRHFHTSCIFTSHNATAGNQTKVILNEATSITIFPQTAGNKSLNYLCDQYLGLDKKQIKQLKQIDGRWATFIRAYPRCIITEKTAFLIKDME